MELHKENARHNLAVFSHAVRSSGAKFLVLSEASSHGAPADSFFADLRIPIDYPEGKLSMADMAAFTDQTNRWYLEAARDAGALTYDLAKAVGPRVNGPTGGEYMYAGAHYTPEGCREVARWLRPVLRRVLEGGRP